MSLGAAEGFQRPVGMGCLQGHDTPIENINEADIFYVGKSKILVSLYMKVGLKSILDAYLYIQFINVFGFRRTNLTVKTLKMTQIMSFRPRL